MANKLAKGIIRVSVDGTTYRAKGNFTYNLGGVVREGIVGATGIDGFKETHVPAFIEGEITDDGDFDMDAFRSLGEDSGATAVLELKDGRTFAFADGWYAGDGTFNTEEGNGSFRFEAARGERVS